MLAMDIPVAAMTGMVLAEAGKQLAVSKDKDKRLLLRFVALAYSAIFFAPTPVYYFLGWPAWEVNYIWPWVDNILDQPLRAAFAYVLLACSVLPTWAGLEVGMKLLQNGKDTLNRIIYICLLLITGVIILLLLRQTFNVSSTHAKHLAGESYSLCSSPFIVGLFLTYVYYWGSLVLFYLWLKKKK
jgi:hypothetical protein